MCDPVTLIVGGLLLDEVANDGQIRRDIIDFVVDDVLEPIADAVSTVMEAVLDDPIKAIAQIAAVATGNAWALPLIEGADVAIAGGDLGDVLKAVATSYVAQNVGSYVGKTVGSYVSDAATAAQYGVTQGSQQAAALAAQEAGMRTASQIAGQIAGSASGAAAVAVVTGQDPVKAFVSGGVSAAVPAILGQVPGFTKLPPSGQQVIAEAVRTQLAGGNVTTAVIGSALQASGIVTDIINSFDPDGTKLTPAQRAVAADVLMGTTVAALSGGNVPAAIQAMLIKNGSKALGDMLTDGFKSAVDGVSSKYDAAQKAADAADANIAQQEKVAAEYNKVVTELNGRVAEQDRLKAEYDTAAAAQRANPTQATTDAANAAAKRYNDFVSKLNADYESTYKPQIDKYAGELAKIQEQYGNLEQVYQNAVKDVASATDKVKEQVAPVIDTSNKAFVEAMDPNFRADEYRRINGLGADVDVYDHWLSKGQFEGLKTNDVAAQADVAAQKGRLVTELAEAKGISISQIAPKDIESLYNTIDTKYGGNLSALKAASIQDFITGAVKSYDDLMPVSADGKFRVEVAGVAYGDWNKKALADSGYVPPAGTRLATAGEFDSNVARLTYTPKGQPVWLMPDTTGAPKVWDATAGDYVPQTPEVVVVGKRLSDLQADDPEAWLVMAGSVPGDGKGGVDDFLYNFAKSTMELAKATGNSTIINGAGNALKAGGGILEAFNGLVVLAGKNPNNTAVGQFAEKLTNLGKATTTAEYQAAVKDIRDTIGNATGVMGTAKAIWGAASKYPAEFLAEIVGVEGMQEVVPLLIGGGAATAAKGLAIARGMGTTLAAQWGTRAGISAAAASDIAESVGGTAQGAFTEAYNLARAKGMSEADATKTALEIASRTGLTAGVITATTLGIGGGALEKAILGKAGTGELASVIDALGKRVKEGGTITIKEGTVEGIEEGLSQAYLEGQLYQLDPTRDIAGNIASSSILGAIAGGGVAGGAYGAAKTGDVVSNLLISSNPTVAATVNDSSNPAAAATALANLGITDAKLQANLLNTKYDSAYTSTAEARSALAGRNDFVASDTDIAALVGATPNANLASAVEAYVDPRVFDVQEAKAAAAAEGYTLTDEQAAALVGQKDEAAAVLATKAQYDPQAVTFAEARQYLTDAYKSAVFDFTPSNEQVQQFVGQVQETAQQQAISTYAGENTVTFDEAKKYLTDLGYTPTDDEVTQFVAVTNEQQQAAAISQYVDPRMVSEQEARDAYAALGLKKPTQADVAKLVGQYAQSELGGKAELNLDAARYNSLLEQIEAIGQQSGVDPAVLETIKADLNAQITALGGDVTALSNDVAAAKADLKGAIDAAQAGNTERFGDIDAAIQALRDAGLTTAQVQAIVEQSSTGLSAEFKAALDAAAQGNAEALGGVKAELESKIGAVQTALESALGNQSTAFNAKVSELMAQGQTYQEATAQALADMGVQLSDLGADFAAKLSDVSTGITQQIGDVQSALEAAIADAKAAGLQGDAALQAAIDSVAGDLGTTRDALLSQLGTTESQLRSDFAAQIGAVQTQIGDVQKAIADQMAAYEAAGVARDDALSLAITDVSGQLGTTKTELLAQLGTTEANLKAEIASQVGGVAADVQAKYDALTAEQKALADALAQQGIDLNAAITQAQQQTQQQITGVQQDVQTKYDALTQGQKDLAAQLQQQGFDLNTAIELARQETQQRFTDVFDYLQGNQTATQQAIAAAQAAAAADAERTRQAQAAEAERTRQANAAAALKTQRMGNLNTLMGMLGQAPDLAGQQVTVKAPDPAKIGYIYDWSSIFANPSQEKMFATPYAQGGAVRSEVDDVNDELLKLLRG